MLNEQRGETFTGANGLQEQLVSIVAQAVGIETSRIDIYRPLTRYGLDSLSAVELAHSIESQTGLLVQFSDLLRGPSIAELVNMTQVEAGETFAHLNVKDEQELSPGQQALWFLHQLAPGS